MKYEVSDLQTLRAALDGFCSYLKMCDISEESLFDSRLVVSELAGNVLKHTRSSAVVEGELVNGKIEVEVRSETPFRPPVRSALPESVYAENGRGLFLVDCVSEKRFFTPEGGIRVIVHTRYNTEK